MFRGLFGSRSHRRYTRGIEQFNAGHLTEAIATFDDVLALDAEGPDAELARFYRAQAHARLGAACLDSGDHHRALDHLDAALEENRRFPDLHLRRALALLHIGDALAAESAARSALDLNPGLIDAGAILVIALRAQGAVGRAREAADRWTEAATRAGHPLAATFGGPDDLLSAFLAYRTRQRDRSREVDRAETCLREGFWDEAAVRLAPLVAETPHYPDLRLRLAAAHLGRSDLEAARAELGEALSTNPRFADAHVLAGIVELRAEAVARAREHFESAGESGRVPLPALYGEMLCDLRSGNLQNALSRMNRLAGEEAPPDDARVLHALLEAAVGRRGTAIERFDAVLPQLRQTDLLVDVVVWATSSAELELANRALDRIHEPERTLPEVVLAHARLREREGSLDRARSLCESALLACPTHRDLRLELARLFGLAAEGAAGLRCLEGIGGGAGRGRALRIQLLRQAGRSTEARALLDAGMGDDDEATALERLYLLRMENRAADAGAVYQQWADPLQPKWRIQDPGRWLRPLRPWPDAAAPVESTS